VALFDRAHMNSIVTTSDLCNNPWRRKTRMSSLSDSKEFQWYVQPFWHKYNPRGWETDRCNCRSIILYAL